VQNCRWISIEELERRRHEWHRLAVASAFPTSYLDPAWVLSWWRAYGAEAVPWCLGLEDDAGALRGLAPLALRNSGVARTLSFAGGQWNGLESLLYAPGAETELTEGLLQALDARASEWDLWRIRRLPTESSLAQRLLGSSGSLRAVAHDLRLQPFIELPPDESQFDARFPAKQRQRQRRRWRRLLDEGVTARLVSDPTEVDSAVRALLELRRGRAITHRQRHAHMDTRFEGFLAETVRELLPDGAHLWILEADGQTIASLLNLVEGPRIHGYLIGVNELHAKLSPGRSLKRHAIVEAIAEGRTEMDLGPGRDESKYQLGGIDRELTRLVVPSRSWRGRLNGVVAGADLRLRDTAIADMLRRRRGMTSERARHARGDRPG
jgi:CelD/BcsL family acetyltransferase involved in cellulose biosynthesis